MVGRSTASKFLSGSSLLEDPEIKISEDSKILNLGTYCSVKSTTAQATFLAESFGFGFQQFSPYLSLNGAGAYAKGDILFSPRKAPLDHRNSSSINHHFLIVLSPSGCASTKFHKFIKATEPATELIGDDDH